MANKEDNIKKGNKILPEIVNKHNIKINLFTAENKEGELREQPKISSTNS